MTADEKNLYYISGWYACMEARLRCLERHPDVLAQLDDVIMALAEVPEKTLGGSDQVILH